MTPLAAITLDQLIAGAALAQTSASPTVSKGLSYSVCSFLVPGFYGSFSGEVVSRLELMKGQDFRLFEVMDGNDVLLGFALRLFDLNGALFGQTFLRELNGSFDTEIGHNLSIDFAVTTLFEGHGSQRKTADVNADHMIAVLGYKGVINPVGFGYMHFSGQFLLVATVTSGIGGVEGKLAARFSVGPLGEMHCAPAKAMKRMVVGSATERYQVVRISGTEK